MTAIKFPCVIGEAAKFQVKKSKVGFECYLNGQLIPAVISQKLIVGTGTVPYVRLEIAVDKYETEETKMELS